MCVRVSLNVCERTSVMRPFLNMKFPKHIINALATTTIRMGSDCDSFSKREFIKHIFDKQHPEKVNRMIVLHDKQTNESTFVRYGFVDLFFFCLKTKTKKLQQRRPVCGTSWILMCTLDWKLCRKSNKKLVCGGVWWGSGSFTGLMKSKRPKSHSPNMKCNLWLASTLCRIKTTLNENELHIIYSATWLANLA